MLMLTPPGAICGPGVCPMPCRHLFCRVWVPALLLARIPLQGTLACVRSRLPHDA